MAIGFAGMFSNSLLLGVPITERDYGQAALAGNYAIISIHSPLFYTVGISMMEWVNSRGAGLSAPALGRKVAAAVFRQPMVVGILLGFVVNLSGVPQPQALRAAVDIVAQAAIPTALFALGGILLRYRPEGDRLTIAMICAVSLILHPLIGYGLARWVFGLGPDALRSVVMTAAMAPGVNAYMFANLYGVAKRVNAAAVLIATAVSIPTIWIWLHILP